MTPEQFDARYEALIDTIDTPAQKAQDLSAQIGEGYFLETKTLQQRMILQRYRRHWLMEELGSTRKSSLLSVSSGYLRCACGFALALGEARISQKGLK